MRIKCFRMFFIFLLLNSGAKGSTITEKVDSLKRLLETAKEDTQKVNLMNNIAYELSSNSPDTALQFAQDALHLSEKFQFKKGIAASYNNMGGVHHDQGNYPLALEYYQKSLKIKEEVGDKKGMAASYNNMGNVYDDQGNSLLALEYYQKSLKIKEEVGDKKGMASSYNNIGLIHKNQGNYPLALGYYQKSLKTYEELGDKKGMAGSYNNIGFTHSNQGNYPLALEYYQKSLKIQEEVGDKIDMSVSYNNIGIIHSNQGNYPLALEYYQKSLKIQAYLGDKKGMAASYSNMGGVHYFQGNYPLALEYYQKSLKIIADLGDKKGMTLSYNNIGNIHFFQGNYPLALEYYQKSLKIKEELGDKKGMAVSYNNIGSIYFEQGYYDMVLENYFASLKIFEEIGDKKGMAGSFINIGELFSLLGSDTIYNQELEQKVKSVVGQNPIGEIPAFKSLIPAGRNGMYHLALRYLLKALNVAEEIGDRELLTYAFPNIGELYVKTNKVSEAIPYYIRSIEIAKEIGSTPTLSDSYLGVSEAWFQLSNQTKNPEKKVEYLSKAFESLQKHVTLKDTLFNEQSIRSINEMQTKYETEKKEREIEKQASKIKLQDSEISRKKLQQYVLIGALIIVFMIVGLLYNRFLIKKKSNRKLTNLNDQLQTANTQLQQKSNELLAANEQITQEKNKVEEYADALKNSNKELETFASICSHDLKEPLRKIRYNSEMLVRKTDHLGKDEKDILTRIDNAANRMNTLITDLLAYSHVTTKQLPHEPVDLNIILKDVLTDLEVKISDTRGKVEVDKLPTIEAVPLHMRQLFQNLISNALKFHKPDVPPVVKIKIRNLENSTYQITVEDNGIGFEQKHADQIFKPFHRLHTRTAYEGTGMGTTICDRIVKKLGGDIRVKSELEKGTCFTIMLPAKQKIKSI